MKKFSIDKSARMQTENASVFVISEIKNGVLKDIRVYGKDEKFIIGPNIAIDDLPAFENLMLETLKEIRKAMVETGQ